MIRWPGRAALEQRLARLERGQAKADAALGTIAATAEAGARREAYVMQTLQEIATRLLAVETRAREQAEALRAAGDAVAALADDAAASRGTAQAVAILAGDGRAAADRLDALAARVDDDEAGIGRLRLAVIRLEHQADAQAEEARRSVAAILELVVGRTRPGSGPA